LKLFIDSANIAEIREAASWGVISGVTTNPSLASKEKTGFAGLIAEIASIVDGPISAEVLSLNADAMIKEGLELAAIAPNVIIKVPITLEGLKAVNGLKKEGVDCNVTLVFSTTQALLAARAGATYLSPFAGRLDDIGADGMALVEEIADIFTLHSIETQVIAASIRHPMHVVDAAKAGADIATVPYSVLLQMAKHPLTDAGIEKFLKDSEGMPR